MDNRRIIAQIPIKRRQVSLFRSHHPAPLRRLAAAQPSPPGEKQALCRESLSFTSAANSGGSVT